MLPHKFLRSVMLAFLVTVTCSSNAQFNLVQSSFMSFPGQRVAGVWHYVDTLGNEYALVGTEDGISIVDVTDPFAPNFILQVPGITNLWHEVKTWGPYAYAVTEGQDIPNHMNDGLQIIDLRYLPDSAPAHYWKGDAAIAGLLNRAHSVTVDNGYVYINGHNISTGLHRGVIIADLVDPLNPHYIGADTMRYCHDSFVRGDTLYASELSGGFAVYDISNRASPVLLATQSTPFNFNHNTWLSDNSQVLFTTDEQNHAPLAAYDVSDLNNIELLDVYSVLNIVNPNYSDEVHNVRVLNDFLLNACYGSQVTIVDAARPANLIEVGNFPILTDLGWDVDPYLPSGNILATGENTGLYVLAPVYQRACYLEGNVTDSITGLPLNTVQIQIQLTYVNDITNFMGDYKTGYVTAGTYNVQFSKTGYTSKIIPGVVLSNGVLVVLDVQLVPVGFTAIEETVVSLSAIFPNPFSESTQLIIDQNLFQRAGSLNVVLKDVTGRVVRQITNIPSSTVRIFKNELAGGMYFYEVTNDVSVISKGKMIVE